MRPAADSGVLTFVMTVCPSWAATKSFTLPGAATPRWLPPMKCGARLCFAAHELGAPLAEPLTAFFCAPAILSVGIPMQGVVVGENRRSGGGEIYGQGGLGELIWGQTCRSQSDDAADCRHQLQLLALAVALLEAAGGRCRSSTISRGNSAIGRRGRDQRAKLRTSDAGHPNGGLQQRNSSGRRRRWGGKGARERGGYLEQRKTGRRTGGNAWGGVN